MSFGAISAFLPFALGEIPLTGFAQGGNTSLKVIEETYPFFHDLQSPWIQSMKVLEFDGHPDNSRAKDSHKNVIYYFYFEISYKFSKIITSETDSVGPQLRVHRTWLHPGSGWTHRHAWKDHTV